MSSQNISLYVRFCWILPRLLSNGKEFTLLSHPAARQEWIMSRVSEYFPIGKMQFWQKEPNSLAKKPVMNYLASLLLDFSPLCLFFFLHLFEHQFLIWEGRTIICRALMDLFRDQHQTHWLSPQKTSLDLVFPVGSHRSHKCTPPPLFLPFSHFVKIILHYSATVPPSLWPRTIPKCRLSSI